MQIILFTTSCVVNNIVCDLSDIHGFRRLFSDLYSFVIKSEFLTINLGQGGCVGIIRLNFRRLNDVHLTYLVHITHQL